MGKFHPISTAIIFFGAAQKVTSRNHNFEDVAVLGWFKFFNWSSSICYSFKKWKLFPFAAREEGQFFRKKADRLTLACENVFFRSILGSHTVRLEWDFWRVVSRIRFFFFVFCIFFFNICAIVSNNCGVLFKVKWKRYLRDACQIIHWWRYFCDFCLTFCEIFANFYVFFLLVYFTRYWLIICW